MIHSDLHCMTPWIKVWFIIFGKNTVEIKWVGFPRYIVITIYLKKCSGPKFLQLTGDRNWKYCKQNIRSGFVQARYIYDDLMLTINQVQVLFNIKTKVILSIMTDQCSRKSIGSISLVSIWLFCFFSCLEMCRLAN